MIYDPSRMPPQHPDPAQSTPFSDINSRLGPFPPEKTCILFDGKLPVYFVRDQQESEFHGEQIIAGRGPQCQLPLSSIFTAQCHAIFTYQNGHWYLCDLHSKNGTFLNGERLEPGKQYWLDFQDEITFADETIIIGGSKPQPSEPDFSLDFDLSLSGHLDFPDDIYERTLPGLILHYRYNQYTHLFCDVNPLILYHPSGQKLTIDDQDIDSSNGSQICSIFPEDPPHAPRLGYFCLKNGEWFLCSCRSSSDICLNDKPLVPDQHYPLFSGDIIRIGTIPLSFGEPAEDLAPGRIFRDTYRLLQRVSADYMVQTYLMEDLKLQALGKKWIGKIFDKGSLKSAPLFDHFCKTVKQTAPFDHAMIPRAVDFFQDGQYVVAVYEYIQGQDLSQILRESGPLSADDVIGIGIQMCDVLGYLHDQKPRLIHRDIKPANIVRKSDGRLMLIDFDIMLCCEPEQLEDAMLLGTSGYAAPEQYRSVAELTPATDIYALGVTLHQLVTGADPQRGQDLLPIRRYDPRLPGKLERIIQKCMQRNPKDRYQSSAALKADLEKAKSSRGPLLNWFSH